MTGTTPTLHVKTKANDGAFVEVGAAWLQAKGHFYGKTKYDISAGSEITSFIDRPKQEDAPPPPATAKKVLRAKKPAAA